MTNINDNPINLNSITIENTDVNNSITGNSQGQGLFKVFKKTTTNSNKDAISTKTEKEQKDKENHETNDKMKAENIIITNDDEG